jgi:predicted transcriptional regulator
MLNLEAYNDGCCVGDPMGGKRAFIMMIQKKWWNEFRHQHHQGRKIHSYVRRGAAPPKDASLILFYVTKPVGEVAGYAELIERKVGEAEELWEEHGAESVLSSKEQYEEFVRDSQRVSFVRFKDLHEASKPIPLNDIFMLLGIGRLSRKGFYVDKETADKLILSME